MDPKRKKYHSVFIPFTDVYTLGGDDVFNQLVRTKEDNKTNLVVLPFPFLKELDYKKQDAYSFGAKEVLEFLKDKEPIKTEEGWLYEVSSGLDILITDTETQTMDSSYFGDLAQRITSSFGQPELITTNQLETIRHRMTGLTVSEPKFLQADEQIVYEGVATGSLQLKKALDKGGGVLTLEQLAEFVGPDEGLFLNKFFIFQDQDTYQYARIVGDNQLNQSKTRIVDTENVRLQLLGEWKPKPRPLLRIGEYEYPNNNVLGISPRDVEQYISLQHNLLDSDISLFFLCGSQGSGKTLLSYVAAVDLILWYDKDVRKLRMGKDDGDKSGFFDHMVLLKPSEILGGKRRDPGALPGTLFDKLEDHLGPYMDAHRESMLGKRFSFEQMILHPRYDNKYGKMRRETPLTQIDAHLPGDTEAFELVYSGFIGGRSFRDTLLLIDEAQNFTPYEIKTILSRLGEGCKCVLMGDPIQVYNPLCSREINGLTYAIQYYLGKPYVGLVNLGRNYRSQISEDADEMKVHSI